MSVSTGKLKTTESERYIRFPKRPRLIESLSLIMIRLVFIFTMALCSGRFKNLSFRRLERNSSRSFGSADHSSVGKTHTHKHTNKRARTQHCVALAGEEDIHLNV